MRAIEFLLEYDLTQTVANYADALYQRVSGYKGDDEFDPNVADDRGRDLLGLVPTRYYDWGSTIIEFFEANDPSGGKFVLPMIRWYLDGSMRSLEDAPKLKGPIATYIKFRNRIKGLDLRKVSFDEFLDTMEAQEGKLSNAEADKAEEQGYYERKEALLILDDETLKIVLLKTMAASCFFGRNTRWCTTSRDKNSNMFNGYAKDGPLFVILEKATNHRWQYHFDCAPIIHLRRRDHQFMDEQDHPVCPLQVMGGVPLEAIFEWANEHNLEPLIGAIQEVVVDFEDHCSPDDYDRWCVMTGVEQEEREYKEDEDEEDNFDYDFHDPRQLKLDL
jgi:hypothetical protein